MTKLIDFAKSYVTFPMLITSFFLTNTFFLIRLWLSLEGQRVIPAHAIYNREYSANLSLFWFAVIFMFISAALILMNRLLPKLRKKAPLLLLIGSWVYFIAVIHFTRVGIYTTFGMLAVMAVIIFYVVNKNGSLPGLSTRAMKIILCILFAGTALFIGAATVARYVTFWSPAFDFGIFTQMFEYMRTTGDQLTTVERDGLLSHFAVHISPVYYLLLPIYMIFPNPITLQVSQAVVVASSLIPLYLICRIRKLPNIATLFVSIAFAFYPALSGGCMYDLHENMFLTAFLLWMLYFLEKTDYTDKAWIGVFTFALLVFSVKENAPIYVAVVALYAVFGRKKVRLGLILFFLSVFYFGLAIWILGTFGRGVMTDSRLGHYAEGGDMSGVIRTILTNPAFIIREIFTVRPESSYSIFHDRILYMLRMLVPLSLLPIAGKKPASLFLIIPVILMNLMPTWIYQFDIRFHYHFGNCALFFYLFILNISEIKTVKIKKFILIFSMTASIFMFTSEKWDRRDLAVGYLENPENRERYRIVTEVVAELDKDKSVTAATFLVAHLYRSKELYDMSNSCRDRRTDYIVLDLRWHDQRELIDFYKDEGYSVKIIHDNIIAVMEKN